jgi:hypothetical protein
MKKSTMNRIGVTLFAATVLSSISPQVAQAAPSCGNYGSMTEGYVCTYLLAGDTSQDGLGNFTIPEGATNLQAIIIGAGGGAYYTTTLTTSGAAGQPFVTYTGNAGKVRYADLSALPSGTVLTLTSGKSGRGSYWPTAGNASSISYGTTNLVADGGELVTGTETPCTYSVTLANITTVDPAVVHQGSSALADSPVNGSACGEPALGVDPQVDHDSFGNAPLSMYGPGTSSVDAGHRFGDAGALDATVDPMSTELRVRSPEHGDGGSIAVEIRSRVEALSQGPGLGRAMESFWGGTGAIFLRWTAGNASSNSGSGSGSGAGAGSSSNGNTSGTDALASTGSNDGKLALFAGIALALGLAVVNFVPRGRRRANNSKKH